MRALFLLILLSSVLSSGAQESAGGTNLALPTDNDALFRGGGAEFYQHIERNYKGEKSTPWQGGQYGFVRNPLQTASGMIYTRFHEGIDIRPTRRDARGEPLDEVRAIADGTVVHVNLVPSYSNYGKYVVVEHRWDGASYYSLYGHLASVVVQAGERVAQGAQLGVMGYTGAGLDQSRAHVHLELNLLLSRRFESWHDYFIKSDPNRHGIYNGINLTGVDVARLYLAQRKQPLLSLPKFLSAEDTAYKVILPASEKFDLPKRYPWLVRDAATDNALSWEVSFNRAGVPLKVTPAENSVTAPSVSYVKRRGGDYANMTRGVIGGSGEDARLTESGARLMRLLIWPD